MINKQFSSIYQKLKYSPTFTSWASIFARTGNTILVLPLILSTYEQYEVNAFLLLSVIFSLKDILDFGFLNNIARFYSYSLGGSTSFRKLKESNKKNFQNKSLINALLSFSNKLYNLLAVIAFVLFAILGTISIFKPFSFFENQTLIYLAWSFQVLVISLWILGNKYSTLLIGFNKIPLLKRWDAIFTSFQVISMSLLVILNFKIEIIIITLNMWNLLIVIRNWYLYRILIKSESIEIHKNKQLEAYVLHTVFPLAKREFLSGIMGFGLFQSVNVFYANIASPTSSASYLLAMKIGDQIKQVARAPFYSKIPFFSTLFITNRKRLFQEMRFSQMLSYATLLVAIFLVYFFADAGLKFINSDTPFVQDTLWLIIGFYILIERFTAMHHQAYVIVYNKVISHIGQSVVGIITVSVFFFFIDLIGAYSIPVGLIFGYLSFFSWYVAKNNYAFFKKSFIKFECYHFIPVAILLIATIIFEFTR